MSTRVVVQLDGGDALALLRGGGLGQLNLAQQARRDTFGVAAAAPQAGQFDVAALLAGLDVSFLKPFEGLILGLIPEKVEVLGRVVALREGIRQVLADGKLGLNDLLLLVGIWTAAQAAAQGGGGNSGGGTKPPIEPEPFDDPPTPAERKVAEVKLTGFRMIRLNAKRFPREAAEGRLILDQDYTARILAGADAAPWASVFTVDSELVDQAGVGIRVDGPDSPWAWKGSFFCQGPNGEVAEIKGLGQEGEHVEAKGAGVIGAGGQNFVQGFGMIGSFNCGTLNSSGQKEGNYTFWRVVDGVKSNTITIRTS